jgi:phage-related protein
MPKLFNNGTNKQGLIVYGGESSADYGMVVSEAPAYERPNRKQTVYTVPGRNGAVVFQEDAWEDVQRSYNVWLAYDMNSLADKLDAFEAMLNSMKGWQRLEDNFEPDVFRLAYYTGGDSFSNQMTAYGEATINFNCRPERFLKTGEFETAVVNATKLVNPTRFTAKPLIHIEGSGTFNVQIGGNTIVATMTDYINIDCETMNAYRLPAENKNADISGSFPIIKPGENIVGITGAPTKVTVVPRYFTI